MCLVWVRRVLSETKSRCAISGPVSSVASSRSTSSSRSLSPSARGGRTGGSSSRPRPARGRELVGRGPQQRDHRRTLVEEEAPMPARNGASQRLAQRRERRVAVAQRVVRQRPYDERVRDAAAPPGLPGLRHDPVRQGDDVVEADLLGHHQPGQGEPVELREVVGIAQVHLVIVSPGAGVGQPALGDADPGPSAQGWAGRRGSSRAGRATRASSSAATAPSRSPRARSSAARARWERCRFSISDPARRGPRRPAGAPPPPPARPARPARRRDRRGGRRWSTRAGPGVASAVARSRS